MPKSPEQFQPGPEERAQIEKSRTISDAELLKGGSEYVFVDKGEFRLEITPDQYVELHRQMEHDLESAENRKRNEIAEELNNTPIDQIIKSHPELAEEVETFELGNEGGKITLFRIKGVPELAIPVWQSGRGTHKGKVDLFVNDPRTRTEEPIKLEYGSICACSNCKIETMGVGSPHLENKPSYPEYKKLEGETSDEFNRRHDLEVVRYKKACEQWENSDDARNHEKWLNDKKEEFVKLLEVTCDRLGVEYLAVRHADNWKARYGSLPGVTVMESSDVQEIWDKIHKLNPNIMSPREKALRKLDVRYSIVR